MNDFLFFCLFIIVICSVVAYGTKVDTALAVKYKPYEEDKKCPPHKWECLDQPGMPGSAYMMCKKCHMLPGITTGRD
jgi:hypothetical protein